ncbi:cilia- and flagella-associated protein 100 [Marchantia polymorpha subsp. ruderalis]|uniref:DUF4200 domain-containing protein n=2 Tax=Marchantia polymorpha TaxID=3197 RepID=A0AAF6AND2_MARPO|nr:hypothetical protein MARPO_0096s0028 [Marchantia polymorpha]BBM97952.1 hypothetical protein Mp_1g09730 [Marchantia polymorpha subsp. ruderalis]|eukprot:PTQ32678.1 hypothetical protein MARPO_0096s0028 [Marchantia polymorpha]
MTVSAASTNVTGTTHSSSSTSEETSPANPDAAPENHVNFDTSTTPPVPMRGISLRSPSQTDMFFKTRTVSEADALIRARTQSQADAFLRALAPDASFLKAPDTFDIEIGPRKSSVGSYLRGDPNALLEEELEYMSEEVQELHEDVEIQKPVVPEDWEKDEVCREWAKDPFVMPDDDRVFRIRDAQRRREKKERREQAAWSVREKTTFASRMGAAVGSEKLRVILRELEKEWENMLLRLNKELPKPALQTVFYHRDEETVLEFVAKKREIFLVQMSLDTRRAEIRKLQDRIFQREEALKKSEGMLEEDSLEFDAFLKRNDAAVQEAVKTAEQETKRRQDKIIEIKKLNSAIATINSDLNKFGEQLDDCKKYKDFLIKLTPKEWFEEQAKIKQQAQELEALKARQLLKSAGDSSTTSDRSKYHGDHDAVSSSPVDDIDDEVEVEETMYFQQPHQLLEIFSDLEVENLALMQQSQDVEGALENLKTKLRETQGKNDLKISGLRSQLQVIETAVKNEEERQRMMQSKTSLNTEDKKHDISLEQLTRKVVEVYARAGLDSDASLSTLQMLTNLEAKLEENLLGIDHIPPEYVEQQERIREKERRLKVRQQKLELLRQEHEARRLRSLERARAPIFKRVGKPPMYRVNLVKKKRKPKIDASGIDEEVELAEFLEREY